MESLINFFDAMTVLVYTLVGYILVRCWLEGAAAFGTKDD